MLSGEYYLANDPELLTERTNCKRLLHRLNVTEYVVGEGTRKVLAELIPNAPANLYI